MLKKVYGYSRREIAEIMGLTENTVQTQIARGMKRCTYFMEQIEKERQRGGRQGAGPTGAVSMQDTES